MNTAGKKYPPEFEKLYTDLRDHLAPHIENAKTDEELFNAIAGLAAILGEHVAIVFSFLPDEHRDRFLEPWIVNLKPAIENALIHRLTDGATKQ